MSEFAKIYFPVDRGQVLVYKTTIDDIKTNEITPCLMVNTEIENELYEVIIEATDIDHRQKLFQECNETMAATMYDLMLSFAGEQPNRTSE